jgi:TonB family protein
MKGILTMVFGLAVAAGLSFGEDTIHRVSHTVALQSATTKVVPEYSPIAKQLKIQGSVQLDAVIAEDGSVERVDIVSGNPVLTKPASDALKKWHFKPFTDGDKPIKVIATFDFDFKM